MLLENRFSETELDTLDGVMKVLREYGATQLVVQATGPVTIVGKFHDQHVEASAHDFSNACRSYRRKYYKVMGAADTSVKEAA